MRDKYKILAAKEMQQGEPKKGMVQMASFRWEFDARHMWNHYVNVTMDNWYLQFVCGKDILEVYDPKPAGKRVTGHLS